MLVMIVRFRRALLDRRFFAGGLTGGSFGATAAQQESEQYGGTTEGRPQLPPPLEVVRRLIGSAGVVRLGVEPFFARAVRASHGADGSDPNSPADTSLMRP